MSVKFPISEFFESSGNAAAVFTEQLRDGIATFACTLWANYPDFITESTNPGNSWARGFMNQMCSPIQPPIAPPNIPFTGGQCVGVSYDVTMSRLLLNVSNCSTVVNDNFTTTVTGPVQGVSFNIITPNAFNTNCSGLSNAPVDLGNWVLNSASGTTIILNNAFVDPSGMAVPPLSLVTITNIVRTDGMPDTCGDPPGDYGSPTPSSNDLTSVIIITNLDTLNNQYTIVYNKNTNQYNFPMNFKINGVNATLDIGGITIFGAPQITLPTSGNDVPLPGSDGGDDGVGGMNDETFPQSEYPVVPDLTVPTTAEQLIEYVVCVDGVISTVSSLLKISTASIPFSELIIDILVNILTDVCAIGEVEPTVGLPEYYGIKAGAERPAIVYLYKEFINDVWQNSTYSSTVPNPTATAVSNIMTVAVPDKTIGTIVYSIILNDGSRIKASGDNNTNALATFNFLLNQVEPAFIPADPVDCTTISEYAKLQVKTLKCRQIEYYPNGKAAGINPTIRRVIEAP